MGFRATLHFRKFKVARTLVPEVFFLVGGDRIERRSHEDESRSGEQKKPLVPTDNNLTSMPTPISFDWHPLSELILETQQTGFSHVE